jgi:hypothetical protein
LPQIPEEAFRRADETPDEGFYRTPRIVTHIDDGAIAAVTQLYRELFPAGGEILDLMSSWVSQLLPEVEYRRVIGLGMKLPSQIATFPRRLSPSGTDWMMVGTCASSKATSKKRATSATSAVLTGVPAACSATRSTPSLRRARALRWWTDRLDWASRQ